MVRVIFGGVLTFNLFFEFPVFWGTRSDNGTSGCTVLAGDIK